jgi:hypothetical protein
MRLSAIRDAAFGRNPEFPEYAGLAAFFADRTTPYGVPVDVDTPLPGNRNSYSYLSTQLVSLLPQPPDLVVVAHALPDCGIETSIAGSVQNLLAGQPMVFAVTDQGRTTGFAALQAAGAMARGRNRAVAMLALDQGTLTYPDPALAGLDTAADHAVGLLFAADGLAELTAMRQLTGVDPRDAGQAALTELIKLVAPDPARHLVFVLGEELHVDGLGGRLAAEFGDRSAGGGPCIREAPSGRLCTAVWSALAAELDTPCAVARTVVVGEYDPRLRYLSLLTMDVPSAWGAK